MFEFEDVEERELWNGRGKSEKEEENPMKGVEERNDRDKREKEREGGIREENPFSSIVEERKRRGEGRRDALRGERAPLLLSFHNLKYQIPTKDRHRTWCACLSPSPSSPNAPPSRVREDTNDIDCLCVPPSLIFLFSDFFPIEIPALCFTELVG